MRVTRAGSGEQVEISRSQYVFWSQVYIRTGGCYDVLSASTGQPLLWHEVVSMDVVV